MNKVDVVVLSDLYRDHLAELARRTDAVCRKHGLDGLVVHSGTAQKKTSFDDQYWPLVTVPVFRHWLPLVVEGCALLVVPGQKPTLYNHVERGFWEGPPEPESPHFWPFYDVVDVRSAAEIRKALRGRIGGLAGVGDDRAFLASLGLPEDRIQPAELLRDLDATRVKKTAYEILCLREANRRACRGHAAVLQAFAAGDHSELELHLLYLRETQQDDPETPYKNIVALNEHAATLHHVSYGREKQVAQSLLLDAGASFLGYDSDITRTAVKGEGAAADVFRQLVQGVDRLQRELCQQAKKGLAYEALHDESHRLLAATLLETGIAKKASSSAASLVDSGVTRKLFPHGLGHSLGLVTHDVGCRQIAPRPDNPFLRNTAVIERDQVFTIEPGCYFIASLLAELRAQPAADQLDWKLVDALVPFGGVRIEDDLLVTDDVVDNFTRPYLP
ncbi:MAG: Xaa-Pro dipeptidase [Deltaproteobacteria bacterium]|nr:Xaa-Pro dipeptidase [Deltaproteobacteria bacterium]